MKYPVMYSRHCAAALISRQRYMLSQWGAAAEIPAGAAGIITNRAAYYGIRTGSNSSPSHTLEHRGSGTGGTCLPMYLLTGLGWTKMETRQR